MGKGKIREGRVPGFKYAPITRDVDTLLRHPEITKYTSCKTWVMPDGMRIVNHNNVMRMDKYKIVNPDGTETIDGLH